MSQNDNSSIAGRTIHSSLYSLIASTITITLGFIRFILLLYFLLPEDFGVFTQAMLFITLASQLRLPGLDLAIIQRQEVNESVRRTYFSMKMGSLIVSVLIMATAAPYIGQVYPTMPLLTGILLALLSLDIVKGLNGVQEALLRRELAFKQIAAADITSAISMTILTPYLAWRGFGAWSLVAEVLVGQISRGGIVWFFARVWWPRPGWNKVIAADLWQFSNKLWGTSVLSFITDRFDDFWIGQAMGSESLGYYSRAYEAARYPRRVIALPLSTVFFSTYARLQDDRQRLSQAFFRLTSLLVRASFGFSLILILAAPEFISLLGETWQPMLVTFQLMIIYTLLDPLAVGAADLLVAIGRPELPFRTNIVQVIIFVPAVILLGSWLGIVGVALAANLMVAIGAIILFWHTHRFVDYSARRLWLWPGMAFFVTGAAILFLNPIWVTLTSWLVLIIKAGLICVIYGGLLFIIEKEEILHSSKMVWHQVQSLFAGFRLRNRKRF
ncbi:MAG: oligosaccharide flippase family protein [Anaerolineaceae bacterium]|nr:oligosaccharide flippase family protein [Anaerolineaceae bacterium]